MSLLATLLSWLLMSGLLEAVPAGSPDGAAIEILEGHHRRLPLENVVTRVAVGNPGVLAEPSILSDREVLLLGVRTGTTTLMIWFDNGSTESRTVVVRRDFSILEAGLLRIDPSIRLQVAPDRDVLVLTGTVAGIAQKRAAVDAAERYLAADAGSRGTTTSAEGPLLSGAGELRSGSALPAARGTVLDLLLLDTLPERLEDRVQRAARDLGAPDVAVRRFLRGDLPVDGDDILVLMGTVANQTQLTRVLEVASQLVVGEDVGPDDIVVLSDESGAIVDPKGGEFAGGGAGSGGAGGAGLGGGSSTASLFGSGSSSLMSLRNRLDANLARAKAVSVAGGRILSFLEVRDLPQVRVSIGVYEVRRSALQSYAPELSAIAGDSVGLADDVTAVVSFLAGGFGQGLELTSGRIAVEAAFQLLESRGIARNLSGPSITVLSGERAQFLVGGEVPIPQNFSPAFGTPDAATGVTPGVFSSVTFRPFGVQLGVRPLIDVEDRVTLDLVTQVARPDANLTTLLRETTGTDTLSTAFETRALQTTARLAGGDVLLLGGLIQRRSSDDASFTPWLESIPGLGWLFKRYSIADEDLEVFVVVNPSVVRDRIRGLDAWIFPALDATSVRK